jgi:hypothetical protein
MTDTVAPVNEAERLNSARSLSNLLALWAMCEHRTCRKSGRCRAVPLTCLKNCADYVPSDVGGFVWGLFQDKADGLSFDESFENASEELAGEFFAWHEAVSRITGRETLGSK